MSTYIVVRNPQTWIHLPLDEAIKKALQYANADKENTYAVCEVIGETKVPPLPPVTFEEV